MTLWDLTEALKTHPGYRFGDPMVDLQVGLDGAGPSSRVRFLVKSIRLSHGVVVLEVEPVGPKAKVALILRGLLELKRLARHPTLVKHLREPESWGRVGRSMDAGIRLLASIMGGPR